MTAFRLISFPVHAAIELAIGLVVLISPFALGFGSLGVIATFALGSLIIGLALSAADRHTNGHRIGAHHAADRGLQLALIVAAIALAVTNDTPASITLLVSGIALLALSLTTRYSITPARPTNFR